MSVWKTLGVIVVFGIAVVAFSTDDKAHAERTKVPATSSPPAPAPVRGHLRDAAPVDKKGVNIVGNTLSREYLKYLAGNDTLAERFGRNFPRPFAVNAYALFQSSQSNIASTDRDFGGKHLLITGHILGIQPGRRESEYIIALPGGFAVFNRDADFVSGLQVGREAQFVCTYVPGLALNGYGLDGCRGMASYADHVALMVLMQPAMLGSDGAKGIQAMLQQAQRNSGSITGPCVLKIDVRACFGLDVEQEPGPDSLDVMRDALKALPAASTASD